MIHMPGYEYLTDLPDGCTHWDAFTCDGKDYIVAAGSSISTMLYDLDTKEWTEVTLPW